MAAQTMFLAVTPNGGSVQLCRHDTDGGYSAVVDSMTIDEFAAALRSKLVKAKTKAETAAKIAGERIELIDQLRQGHAKTKG